MSNSAGFQPRGPFPLSSSIQGPDAEGHHGIIHPATLLGTLIACLLSVSYATNKLGEPENRASISDSADRK